jgi:hypothetical protein
LEALDAGAFRCFGIDCGIQAVDHSAIQVAQHEVSIQEIGRIPIGRKGLASEQLDVLEGFVRIANGAESALTGKVEARSKLDCGSDDGRG